MKAPFLFTLLLGIISFKYSIASCDNCAALVEIHKSDVQAFTQMLTEINSLPLRATKISFSADADFRILLVETWPQYAKENHLNSFDVGKYLSNLIEQPSPWRIKSIKAEFSTQKPVCDIGTVRNNYKPSCEYSQNF